MYETSDTFFIVQSGHNLFTTFHVHIIWSIQNTENWCALFERTTYQIQYFSTWKTICSSHNVQTVLEFIPCVFQHLGCQKKLYCWLMHKVQPRGQLLDRIPGPLYSSKRNKNPFGLYWWSEGSKGLVCSTQSIWISFIQKLTARLQYGGASSYWNKTFGWMHAMYRTADSSSTLR